MAANLPKDPDKRSRPILMGLTILVVGYIIWIINPGAFIVWIAN